MKLIITLIMAILWRWSSKFFRSTDHLLLGLSLADHPNNKQNILINLNGMRMKFSQQLHPKTFKMKIIYIYILPCNSNVYLCVNKRYWPWRWRRTTRSFSCSALEVYNNGWFMKRILYWILSIVWSIFNIYDVSGVCCAVSTSSND